MSLVTRFDPPAYLPDFNGNSAQLLAWHRAVSNWFDASIQSDVLKADPGKFQFFNPTGFDPGGTLVEQAITWNAFPKELFRQFGREHALREADALWHLSQYYTRPGGAGPDQKKFGSLYRYSYRPHNEYCEWRVSRHPVTNQIRSVTFTSEPPELYHALFGGKVPGDTANPDNAFPGDHQILLNLYRELVSPDVQLDDLIATEDIIGPSGPFTLKGLYNPYNKWNTTHGIMHLGAPPNSLTAEIQLGADATIARRDGNGRLIVDPDPLICCAQFGGPDRNSDPTIGSSVNALARLGAYVTLRNPVGLYMDHIDLAGWEAPDDKDVTRCIKIVRGTPEMIERLVVEVPDEWDFTVSDITIAGVPILYGGQIAECITVKLIGIAYPQPHWVPSAPQPCDGRCCIDLAHPVSLRRGIAIGDEAPPGLVAAFIGEGAEEKTVGLKKPPSLLVSAGGTPPISVDRSTIKAKRRSQPRIAVHGRPGRFYVD